MKCLTDEMTSRWAALACLLEEVEYSGHPLRTRLCLLGRAADMLDEIITRHALHQKPDKVRKVRQKATKQLAKLEQLLTDTLLPALKKKDVCITDWAALTDKQREHAAREWAAASTPIPVIPMTPETLAELPSGTVFRVKGDGLQQPWIMQPVPGGEGCLRSLRHGKELLLVPAVSITETEDDQWSVYRVLREEDITLKKQSEASHACRLICGPNAQEETTANVRRMLGLLSDFVIKAERRCDVGLLIDGLLHQAALTEQLRDAGLKSRVPELLKKKHSMLKMLSEDRWLLLHPYDSVKPIITLIQESAGDDETQEICAAASYLAADGKLVEALCGAAIKGKPVTVLIDLRDPHTKATQTAAAQRLRDAGCTVKEVVSAEARLQYDMVTILRKPDDTACYAALCTGSIDAAAGKQQLDMSSIFCISRDSAAYKDLQQVFACTAGETDEPDCETLHLTPYGTRQEWKRLIRREMSAALRKQPCGLQAVVPEITDPELIDVLYDASQAGVPISLTVDGACCLQAGLPGVSEHISVHAYHGEVKLHGCMLYCTNGGKPECWLSTTAWTPEGMKHQHGLLWLAEPAENDERLTELLNALSADHSASWALHVDEYTSLRCCGEDDTDSSEQLITNKKSIKSGG